MQAIFKDRIQAGRLLAEALSSFKGRKDVVLLAIPRGGVPVAKQIAEALDLQLDIIVTRKIGAPGNPEFAVGAVSQDGEVIVERDTLKMLGISDAYLKSEASRQVEEIKSRLRRFRGERPYPKLEGKVVVLVDDGIATGHTIRAAIKSVKKKMPSSVIVAVPVAPEETVSALSEEADKVVCLETPVAFYAIGEFYEDFEQVEDEEVKRMLQESWTLIPTQKKADRQ